jgi:hypothetical protein
MDDGKKKRIKVPGGMARAYQSVLARDASTFAPLEAALLWLSKNPIVPTEKQLEDVESGWLGQGPLDRDSLRYGAAQFQSRMFLAPEPEPEPEVPEEIKDLLIPRRETDRSKEEYIHNAQILKAFRRGQKAGSK